MTQELFQDYVDNIPCQLFDKLVEMYVEMENKRKYSETRLLQFDDKVSIITTSEEDGIPPFKISDFIENKKTFFAKKEIYGTFYTFMITSNKESKEISLYLCYQF